MAQYIKIIRKDIIHLGHKLSSNASDHDSIQNSINKSTTKQSSTGRKNSTAKSVHLRGSVSGKGAGAASSHGGLKK